MTKITWAAASTIAVLAFACTTEVTDSGADGGTSSSSSSSSGQGGASSSSSSTGTAGSTGSGTGGSGGGEMCTAKSDDTACRTCALKECHDEVCACEANSGCGANVGAFYTCLSMASNTIEGCLNDLLKDANAVDGGGTAANDLAGCMMDTCDSICKGMDGGVRRPKH